MMNMFIYVMREVPTVSQLCIFFPYVFHGLCEHYLTCDIAFNAVMPLSHASTHGRYSRIEGVITTLPVLRLLRWARCVYGRPVVVGADYAANGQHGLVLGLGGSMGSLVDAHSSARPAPLSPAALLPTGRLLRRRRIQRGRRSRLRSLLLRRHVDEVDEDLARVNAGSGSHNLDAPYLARQRCRGF